MSLIQSSPGLQVSIWLHPTSRLVIVTCNILSQQASLHWLIPLICCSLTLSAPQRSTKLLVFFFWWHRCDSSISPAIFLFFRFCIVMRDLITIISSRFNNVRVIIVLDAITVIPSFSTPLNPKNIESLSNVIFLARSKCIWWWYCSKLGLSLLTADVYCRTIFPGLYTYK